MSSSPAVTGSGARAFVTLFVLALTAVLSPVSMDMLTPSLPGLSDALGASPQTVELSLYSFLIGYGVSPSLWGALSDRLGRRPVMFTGMAIYTASSLACALTGDALWLIAARFVQGIGGGAGATIARAVVRDIYGAAGTTHGMARMISMMAVVPFFMPLLGGILASLFSFKACFLAMALIGVASVCAYFILIPETRPATTHAPGQGHLTASGILTHPVFAQHAICNMFCISILVIFGANFAFITREQFAFDSASNGLLLAMFNGSIALGTYLAGKLMSRFGTHRAIISGAVACALSWAIIVILAMSGREELTPYAALLVPAGAGCGIIMALCSGAALTPFTHESGTASSIYLLLQSAGSCAISLLVGLTVPKQLSSIAMVIAICACLAIASKYYFSRGVKVA